MKINIVLATAIAILLGGNIASANPHPNPYQNADGQEIAQLFAGKTWKWPDGHAYFGHDGTFQAAVGLEESAEGKWVVHSTGKLCFDAVWRTRATSQPTRQCWQHVVDAKGQLWQAPVTGIRMRSGWNIFDPKEQLVEGNIHESRFDVASGKEQGLSLKRIDEREVARMYFGKTWRWDDGHAYFGNNGALTAIAENNSVGEGKWYVTGKGELCIEARWSSPNYDSVDNKRCWAHASDDSARIWQTPTSDMRAWHVFEPGKNLVNGNPYARRFTHLKRQSDG